MFATDVEIESVCRCGKHISRATSEMNFPLIYPSSPSPLQPLSFAVLVQQSLCRKQQTHMWCDGCARYRPAVSEISMCACVCQIFLLIFLFRKKTDELLTFHAHSVLPVRLIVKRLTDFGLPTGTHSILLPLTEFIYIVVMRCHCP